MESRQPIARGARYRDVQTTVFGQPQPEWIVEGVYRVSDGINHARLVSAADLSARRRSPLPFCAIGAALCAYWGNARRRRRRVAQSSGGPLCEAEPTKYRAYGPPAEPKGSEGSRISVQDHGCG